jgi:very-short-patch-repair endonuclease
MDTLPRLRTRVPRAHVARARELRRNATLCERLVWSALRQLRQTHGLHFRRQAPMGPYIADFCCHGLKVIIEADGDGHDDDRDAQRDAWFARAGYRTIRIGNEAIRARGGDLTGTILRELRISEVEGGASDGC